MADMRPPVVLTVGDPTTVALHPCDGARGDQRLAARVGGPELDQAVLESRLRLKDIDCLRNENNGNGRTQEGKWQVQ